MKKPKKAKKVSPKMKKIQAALKARLAAKAAKPVNMLYPGRPRYKGPNDGWFAFVHHGELIEHSRCIDNRVAYVKSHKPHDEIKLRLQQMMYVPPMTKWMKEAGFIRTPEVKRKVLAYIKRRQPKCTWNAGRGTLLKADGTSMTGLMY